MKKQEKLLGDLLGEAISRAGIMKQVGAAIIVDAGNKSLSRLFDEGIETFAQCLYFTEEFTLVIACTHAAVAQEITLKEKDLIGEISSIVPNAKIDHIDVVHRPQAGRGAIWYDDKYAAS